MEYKKGFSSEGIFTSFMKENYRQFSIEFENMCESSHYAHKLFTKSTRYECWDNGNLVGVLCSYFNENGHFVYIPYLCVLLQYSGRGIASKLMENLIGDSIKSYSYIDLEVRKGNYRAYQFYKRKGFFEIVENLDKLQLRKEFTI